MGCYVVIVVSDWEASCMMVPCSALWPGCYEVVIAKYYFFLFCLFCNFGFDKHCEMMPYGQLEFGVTDVVVLSGLLVIKMFHVKYI